MIKFNLKADSHELCLMCAAVADGCISAEIENFLSFHTSAAAAHVKLQFV